jgi:endoglucanase
VAAPDVLLRLLETAGPSGAEQEAARVWREAASAFADVSGDHSGNSFARVKGTGDRPLVAVFGHLDEIGLIVTNVDDDGRLWFRGIGGWMPEVIVAQRVDILARDGVVPGVVYMRRDPARREEKRGLHIKDLFIDIGAKSAEEAKERIRLGDAAVIAARPLELLNGRLASRALDNRLGAYVAYEAARRIAEAGGASGDVVAVASVQEEVGDFVGARAAAYFLEPAYALVVDITPANDVPGGDPNESGTVSLAAGPLLARGPGLDPALFELLRETAEAEGIEYGVEVTTGKSHTDADAVYLSRAGVRTAVISIPLRYFHSPCELVELEDVEKTIRLVVAAAQRLPGIEPM